MRVKELVFDDFVFQVVCNGQAVIVIGDETAAQQYVADHLKGCEVMILPIAVFDYTERGGEDSV